MSIIEQTNRAVVTALIEDSVNRKALENTDQWITAQLLEAISDRQYAVQDVLAQEEKVIARISVTGTHSGMFAGHAATGRSVTITQFREFHVVDGEIRAHRGWFDTSALLPQLQPQS